MSARLDYDGLARAYDLLAAVGTLGAVARARRHSLRHVTPGMEVLVAGCGTGAFAAEAARAGGTVTAVDLSPRMAERTRRRLAACGPGHRAITCDVRDLPPTGRYGLVTAHYLLDCHPTPARRRLVRRLAALTAPGGVLSVCDVALPGRPAGDLVRRASVRAWYLFFRATTGTPVLPMPDLGTDIAAAGLPVHETVAHGRGGHRTWTLRRGPDGGWLPAGETTGEPAPGLRAGTASAA